MSIIIDDDVTLVESSGTDLYGVKVLKGDYKGVIYCYGKVNVKENTEKDECQLTFDYQIRESPEGFKDNGKFRNYIGDVLVKIIQEQ
tara:strand:+ start:227 stop:487 length:261 start_codon:yes stop_codon:yes gene_type:complete